MPQMPLGQSPTAGPAVRLALATLFGEAFLGRAQPELVSSLEHSHDLWADLLISLWALRLGDPAAPPREQPAPAPAAAHLPPELASQVPGLAGFTPPPRDPFEVPPALGGNGAAVGTMPSAASFAAAVAPASLLPPPPAAVADGKATLEVFDPAVDELAARYAARPRTPEEVRAFLVDLLVEKTGYPPETFEDELDLEVDLGIDTVKQVEVMAAVRQAFQLTVDENFRMRDHTTLAAATEYIVERLEADALVPGSTPQAGAAAPAEEAAAAAEQAAASRATAEAERDEQFTTL